MLFLIFYWFKPDHMIPCKIVVDRSRATKLIKKKLIDWVFLKIDHNRMCDVTLKPWSEHDIIQQQWQTFW